MIVYHAVIDTNVLVSAMLRDSSVPRTIIDCIEGGIVIPVYNESIIQEYREVLSRKKFRFNVEAIDAILNVIIGKGMLYEGIPTQEELPDKKDVVFYEVTMDSRQYQETRLVTGNIKHFPPKSFVVTPREMLDIIINNLSD